MAQRENFRSSTLEAAQAWKLFLNKAGDLSGPVSSGMGSKLVDHISNVVK